MKLARTAVVAAVLAVAIGSVASTAMAARSAAPVAPPIVKIKTANLGLYTWDQEKDFKVHCTGPASSSGRPSC